MVSDCAKEAITQHHLGIGHGHGPVRLNEVVLLAVFERTPREEDHLIATTFPRGQLIRGEISLARRAHTTRATFDERVIQVLEPNFGKCLGVARASAAALRAIRFEIPGTLPIAGGRAICVLDKVGSGDHDGHAALEYSEAINRLTEKQKSRYRPLIHADLAEAFGKIISVDHGFADTGN